MCDYQRGTIECRGDGYCWDADSDGYDPADFDMPCPNCNTQVFLEDAKRDAESSSEWSYQTISGTGVDTWLYALAHAREWNPTETEAALIAIGTVRARKPHPTNESECLEELFTYA